MEKNCVSLETAKRLKTAGFPARGFRWWTVYPGGAVLKQGYSKNAREYYAAPTATEIWLVADKDERTNTADPEVAAAAWLELNKETPHDRDS